MNTIEKRVEFLELKVQSQDLILGSLISSEPALRRLGLDPERIRQSEREIAEGKYVTLDELKAGLRAARSAASEPEPDAAIPCKRCDHMTPAKDMEGGWCPTCRKPDEEIEKLHRTPTARGSMPTREEMAKAMAAAWVATGKPFQDPGLVGMLAEADAALVLVTPAFQRLTDELDALESLRKKQHDRVAALERERDEAQVARFKSEEARAWLKADLSACYEAKGEAITELQVIRDVLAETTAAHTALLETARQAEEENARLRERVAELERPGATLSEWGTLIAERDALEALRKKMHDTIEQLRKEAPPPSASAGTGTISDKELAKAFRIVFDGELPGVPLDLILEMIARRAKELLGGSKAVKHERLSIGDLRVLIRGRMQDFNLTAHNDIVEEVARIAFEIIHGWNYSDHVRAALAGRGET